MTTAKTQFAAGKSPFATLPKPAKVRTPSQEVDPSSVTITHDPLPTRRPKAPSKYDSLFAGMKNKDCLRCKNTQAGGLSSALRAWAKHRYGSNFVVKTCKNYPNDAGYARVWLLLNEKGGIK